MVIKYFFRCPVCTKIAFGYAEELTRGSVFSIDKVHSSGGYLGKEPECRECHYKFEAKDFTIKNFVTAHDYHDLPEPTKTVVDDEAIKAIWEEFRVKLKKLE